MGRGGGPLRRLRLRRKRNERGVNFRFLSRAACAPGFEVGAVAAIVAAREREEQIARVGERGAAVAATIARYGRLLAESPASDSPTGKDVFQRLCVACHAKDGEGGKLGPDLTGSASNGARYFIENIVDPNAVVGENFSLNVIVKKDGAVISGMVESQTEQALTVRTMTGPGVGAARGDSHARSHNPIADACRPFGECVG